MPLNRTWVLQNLRETVEHLETVIAELDSGNDLALESWIEFIYRDLNRAWNGRSVVDPVIPEIPDDLLRKFPTDISFDD